jgi:hypothetical protein
MQVLEMAFMNELACDNFYVAKRIDTPGKEIAC